MRVIPVLDLLDGVVVHGVAGRRESYRPILSRLCASPEPLIVARAFRDRLGLRELYVADLDAILARRPNLGTYQRLADEGFALWIDAGIREADDAASVLASGALAVVAGLETLSGPGVLDALCRRFGAERIVFSLDLREGQPLGDAGAWGVPDPLRIADRAAAAGVKQTIALDLARVGTGRGVDTVALAAQIKSRHPGMSVITGGGVRNGDDLLALAAGGIDGVLVATALHGEAIGRSEIEALRPLNPPVDR